MVHPVRAVQDPVRLARAQIEGEQFHGQPPGQAVLHHLEFVGRLDRPLARALPPAVSAIVGAVALRRGSRGQGLVGIDRINGTTAGQLADFPSGARVNLGGVELGRFPDPFRIVDGRCFSADDDRPGRPRHHLPGLPGGQVQHRDAGGRRVDHLLAIGGVGIVVEIKAQGIRLPGQADDAMARVGIDPGGGRLGGGGRQGEGGRCEPEAIKG